MCHRSTKRLRGESIHLPSARRIRRFFLDRRNIGIRRGLTRLRIAWLTFRRRIIRNRGVAILIRERNVLKHQRRVNFHIYKG
jgi:hypothetical protein